MMLLVLATVVAALATSEVMAATAPAPGPDDISIAMLKDLMPILYDKRTMDKDGGYSYEVETSDGQYRQEVGMILNKGTKEETKVVMGQYSFKDAFGMMKHYMYMADRNGYRVMLANVEERRKSSLRKQTVDKLTKSLLG